MEKEQVVQALAHLACKNLELCEEVEQLKQLTRIYRAEIAQLQKELEERGK